MATSGNYVLAHHDWHNIRAEAIGERVVIRRIRGGSSEAAHLEIGPGGAVGTSGLPTECFLTVLTGRLLAAVLGNEVDLDVGHFVLIPPHVPLTLHNPTRSPAVLVAHCNSVIPQDTAALLDAF